MKITADTNILVRAITEDDPRQSKIAQRLLGDASLVAMPLVSLSEFCWVAQKIYKFGKPEIADVIRTLVAGENVAVDEPGVAAGLAVLDAGGDFADGVIAHTGKWLGADTFVSFDKDAVRLMKAHGQDARTPG